MTTFIQPEDLRLDRSRFPWSLLWKKKVIATVYSTSLSESLKTIVVSTLEINRLIEEKNRLLDHIKHGKGDVSDIIHEKPLSFVVEDERRLIPSGTPNPYQEVTIGSRWTSKKGDLYEVTTIDKKGNAVISWLQGSYTRIVTIDNLQKLYRPTIDNEEEGLNGDDDD